MGKVLGKWRNLPLQLKVSVAYVFCSILQRCLTFITMPLFTRLLTTEQYGQFTIFSSWQGILTIFITLNLAYGSFATAMVKYEDDRDGYLSSIQGITVFLAAVFLLVYLPFRGLWNGLFELPTEFVCIMVAEIVAANALHVWTGKKRFEYKYVSVIAVTLFCSVACPTVAFLLVINSAERGYARILGYAMVNIAVGMVLFVWNLGRGKKFFDKKYWRFALGFNIPLLAYYLSQVVFNQSDRIMISHMVGKDKAAIYGVAYNLAMILNFVLNAVNNSYVPWFYEKLKAGKKEENRSISLVIACLMAVLLSGVIWFAPEIILVMAGKQYAEAVYVVPPVAVSLLLLFFSQLFINVEFYYERKKELVWASIGAALVNLVLNFIFIRWFGFVAAAYTTLASYIVFAAANYAAMKRILREKQEADNAYYYKGLILVFLVFCGVTVVGVLMYPTLPVRIVAAAAVLTGLIVKRQYFLKYYRMIRNKS